MKLMPGVLPLLSCLRERGGLREETQGESDISTTRATHIQPVDRDDTLSGKGV